MVVTAATAAKSQTEQQMTVDELFQLIESNSKTLQVQKTSVEFAKQGVEAARTGRLPDVKTQASLSYNGNVLVSDRDFSDMHGYSAPHLGNSFMLEAQQVVYAGGAVNAGIRLAELQHEQAVVGRQQTLDAQRFLGLGQFLDLYKLSRRQQVYEENIALTQRLIDDIKARHEQGMALKNDITRYELQLESLRLGLRQLRDQQSILNFQLCNQIGLPTGVVINPICDEGTDMPHETLPQLTSTAEVKSPMMQQSAIGMQMAQQQLRLARSEQLPKVALFAADQLNGPYIYDLPPKDVNVNNWFVGVGISYSLSSLFKQNKRIHQAETAARQSTEAHEANREALGNQVQQAWTLYEQSFADLETQRKSVELARQNYNVVSDRYNAGLALVTDMLDASSMKLQAELNEVDARINIAYARYRLKYISGTL